MHEKLSRLSIDNNHAAGQGLSTLRMVLHYRGTRYSGWQRQPDQLTIQGSLEQAFEKILGSTVNVISAGRTDAGVHARGQVAHCQVSSSIETKKIRRSLNAVLPPDIRVFHLRKAPSGFHARKHALRKRYEYRIYNGPVISPFLNDYVLHVPSKLDFKKMYQASLLLEGLYDFSSFAASSCSTVNKIRRISSSIMLRRGLMITYRVEGDGFLHHMVRNIVGTLMQVGFGKINVDDISVLLAARDRSKAGPTAPPQGLCLVRVFYPSNANHNSLASY